MFIFGILIHSHKMSNIQNINRQQVEELRGGSYSAFNELYNIYSDMLYSFIVQLTKSPSEAKDIVQETFLRIWLTRENLMPDKSFKAYLFQIAHNLIIDALRKQVNKISFEQYISSKYFEDYSNNNIEDTISFDDFVALLEQAKQKMSRRQREIFSLSRQQGMDVEEIAKTLNLSEKTVRNNLSIALGIIKNEMLLLLLAIIVNPFK